MTGMEILRRDFQILAALGVAPPLNSAGAVPFDLQAPEVSEDSVTEKAEEITVVDLINHLEELGQTVVVDRIYNALEDMVVRDQMERAKWD